MRQPLRADGAGGVLSVSGVRGAPGRASGLRFYSNAATNPDQVNRLGVPILPDFDISRPSSAQRLSQLPSGYHLHSQMPRVSQGTQGYSSRQLVDTLGLPSHLDRDA